MSANKRVKIFLQILGPIIFIYILLKIDYRFFWEQVKLLKWHFLLLAAILMLFEIVSRFLRWRTILSSMGINVSWFSCLNIYWLGAFVGVVTPGRFGELIKVYFLKHKGQSAFRSFFSVILDRISDILVLFVCGLLIFLFFLKDIGVYIIVLGIIILLAIVFIFLLLDERSFLNKFFRRLIHKIFPIDLSGYSHFSLAKLWQGIRELRGKQIVFFFIFLIAGWFFYFLARYVVVLSLGLSLSFFDVVLISVLMAMVTFLPISIAGLGTREAAVIYLFGLFGLNKEIAVLFSLLIFTIDILTISLGIIPYFRESALINKIKKR